MYDLSVQVEILKVGESEYRDDRDYREDIETDEYSPRGLEAYSKGEEADENE